jgi:hypothetical protein
LSLGVDRVISGLQVGTLLVGIGLLMAFQVPWLAGPLEWIHISDTETSRTLLIVLVLTSLMFEMRKVSGAMSRIASETRQHLSDPLDVYPLLLQRAQSIRRNDQRLLDVLGLNLYTAWPSIEFWLQRPETANWQVRVAAVCSDSGALNRWVPEEWHGIARSNLAKAADAGGSEDLQRRSIRVQGFPYDFAPAVHGFRLGNGDLFLSVLLWEANGLLGTRGYSYEFIPGTEQSAAAHASRQLFDSWFSRAMAGH